MGFDPENVRQVRKISSSVAPAGSYVVDFSTIDSSVPNLLHSTFQKSSGRKNDFMHRFIHEYDGAKTKVRKQMLESFLKYIDENIKDFKNWHASSDKLQEVGHLLLLRAVAHLGVSLPKMVFTDNKLELEMMTLLLQLIHRFITFMSDRIFVETFFESGCTLLFLKILSPSDYNISDDLRSIVIDTLVLIARRDRFFKEALCESDILRVLQESTADTLNWDTLKKFNNLLCELFRNNPRYQKDVLQTIENMLTMYNGLRVCSVTQRVAFQSLMILVKEAPYNEHIKNENWIHGIMRVLVELLNKAEPRLCMDIVRLLCLFVKTYPTTGRFLYRFCEDQILDEQQMSDKCLLLEQETKALTDYETDTWKLTNNNIPTTAFGGAGERITYTFNNHAVQKKKIK